MLQVKTHCWFFFNWTPSLVFLLGGTTGTNSQSIMARKAPTMPKPQWHPPWKLFRVISGHTGWVRCVAVDPTNEWFCTGSADRVIKVITLLFSKKKIISIDRLNLDLGSCERKIETFSHWACEHCASIAG